MEKFRCVDSNVVDSNNSNISGNGNRSSNARININKRKRRSSLDETNDTENKRPRSSPAPSTTTSAAARDRRKFDENRGCEAAVGASDEYVSSLVSPAVIADVLSPLMYDSDNRGESTPHVHKTKRPPTSGPKCTGILSCYVSPLSELRHCPMPQLSWADAANVWQQMCRKDDRSLLERSPEMLSRHPGLLPRMRAILVDWLIEVCEVYKLHRETYYLAIDYLDRYLSSHRDVSKTRLQLIGITCLFIAAKMEEIYPPKIGEFAYVTDGACNEEDIQMQELNLLQGLNWHVSPITVIGWLGVYLQVDVNNVNTIPYPVEMNRQNNSRVLAAIANLETPAKSPASASTSAMASESPSFIFPQFSSLDFAQTSQLVDLCSLDVDITRYPYSVIAASAIRHVLDKETALTVSGFDWETISDCCKWMEPFYSVILEDNSSLFLLEQNEQVEQNFGLNSVCPNLIKDDSYKTQTHTISLGMFDKVIRRREEAEEEGFAAMFEAKMEPTTAAAATTELAMEHALSPTGLMTPPISSRKSFDPLQLAVSSKKENRL